MLLVLDLVGRRDEAVDPAQAIEVVVDVVEQEGVQDLAGQESSAGEGHRFLGDVIGGGGLVAQAHH